MPHAVSETTVASNPRHFQTRQPTPGLAGIARSNRAEGLVWRSKTGRDMAVSVETPMILRFYLLRVNLAQQAEISDQNAQHLLVHGHTV